MPQTDRTKIIVKLLTWLRDVKLEGATRTEILWHIKMEITSMGAAERTTLSYLEDCRHYGLVKMLGRSRKIVISDIGKTWLERHSH